MQDVRYYFQIRNGKGLNPDKLIDQLRKKYGDVKLSRIPIHLLTFDNEIQTAKVAQLCRDMTRGKRMPPIVADYCSDAGGKFKILDGNHRVAAALRLGRKLVLAWVPKPKL